MIDVVNRRTYPREIAFLQRKRVLQLPWTMLETRKNCGDTNEREKKEGQAWCKTGHGACAEGRASWSTFFKSPAVLWRT